MSSERGKKKQSKKELAKLKRQGAAAAAPAAAAASLSITANDSLTPLNKDVLIEILLLLPVRSLLRLRAVCKFWRRLIDSPFFRKLHTCNDNSNGDDNIYLHFTFSGEGERKLVGPVKDLVCIYSTWETELLIAICNPSLAQLKILPNTTPSSCNSCLMSHPEVAIGLTVKITK